MTLQAAARPAAHDDHVARPELAGRRPTRRRPRLPRICCAGPKRGPTAAKPGPVDAPVDAPAQPARGAAAHAALPKRPPNPGPRQRGAVAQFVDVAVAKLETVYQTPKEGPIEVERVIGWARVCLFRLLGCWYLKSILRLTLVGP